jgi:hypothetical protein
MIVRFHPKALEELSETVSYYSEISENLANQFLLAVEHGRT